MNFAHIGFGRSSSTFLNKIVFPDISKITNNEFSISNSNLNKQNSIISSATMVANNWWNPKTYMNYFDKVSVLKYEFNFTNYLYKNIFQIADRQDDFLMNLKKKIYNKSLSKNSIKILFVLNKLLSSIGINLSNLTNFRIKNKFKYKNRFLFNFLKFFTLHFYLKILDYFFFKTPYTIPIEKLDFDFEKVLTAYKNLPDLITYQINEN